MPRKYSASDADPAVVREAYAAAVKLTKNRTVLTALFQAGLVESNFKNLSGGDRDSLGYLQQRPSQGWKNPTNIATATKSFIDKALRILKGSPNLTAGQLAQKVQVSAYPDEYGRANAAASELLAAADRPGGSFGNGQNVLGGGPATGPAGTTGDIGGAIDAVGAAGAAGVTAVAGNSTAAGIAGDAFGSIADAIKDGFEPLIAVAGLSDQVMKLFLPTNIIRLVCGIAGAFFILFGIALLAREIKTHGTANA